MHGPLLRAVGSSLPLLSYPSRRPMNASEGEPVDVDGEHKHRGLAGVVNRTDGLSDVPAVWYAVGAVLLDRAVTLPFWHYEANPLVAGMGQVEWLAVTALLIVGLLVAWYPGNARQSRMGHWVAWAVTAVHLTVVALNVGVVTGVL